MFGNSMHDCYQCARRFLGHLTYSIPLQNLLEPPLLPTVASFAENAVTECACQEKKAAHRLSRFSRNSNHHLVSNKLVRSQKRADPDVCNHPFQNAVEVQGAISDSLPRPTRRRPGTPSPVSPVAPRASALTMLAPPCKCQFSLCKIDRGFRSLYPQQVGDIRPTAHRQ